MPTFFIGYLVIKQVTVMDVVNLNLTLNQYIRRKIQNGDGAWCVNLY